jgi:translation initiation factor 5B
VKAITGLGTTIDVILTNGRLAESQTIVLGGIQGPIVTQIRALLMPQPLKELRVKNQYKEFKEIEAAQGVKITGKELDKALAGSPLFVAYEEDEIEVLKVVYVLYVSLVDVGKSIVTTGIFRDMHTTILKC